MRSNAPAVDDGARPSYQSDKTNSTLASPRRRALSRATSSASAETSVARTVARGRSCAMASAIAPDPVPRSSTRTLRSSGKRASACSTNVSVSGRGISTAGETTSGRPQNSRLPVRYATGSPSRRRRASARNASSRSRVMASPPCATSHARSCPTTCARSTCASSGTRPDCARAAEIVARMSYRQRARAECASRPRPCRQSGSRSAAKRRNRRS